MDWPLVGKHAKWVQLYSFIWIHSCFDLGSVVILVKRNTISKNRIKFKFLSMGMEILITTATSDNLYDALKTSQSQ